MGFRRELLAPRNAWRKRYRRPRSFISELDGESRCSAICISRARTDSMQLSLLAPPDQSSLLRVWRRPHPELSIRQDKADSHSLEAPMTAPRQRPALVIPTLEALPQAAPDERSCAGLPQETHPVLSPLGAEMKRSLARDPATLRRFSTEVSAVTGQAEEAGAPIIHLFDGLVPAGPRLYQGIDETDWVLLRIEDDPLYKRGDFPMPRTVRRRLRRLSNAGVEMDRLLVAHEVPRATVASLLPAAAGDDPSTSTTANSRGSSAIRVRPGRLAP